MSKTTRQNILENIVNTLEASSKLKHVELNRETSVEADTPLPAVFIKSGPSVPRDDLASLGYEAYDMNVMFVGMTEGDPEELFGIIHTLLTADLTRGGYASDTALQTDEFDYEFDKNRGVYALNLGYVIPYTHAVGTP